eukprot:9861526-Alexandrium_andersonii.AAC.1
MTKASLLAALNICKACKQLGGSWVRVNKFSKREEYLYCKSGYKDKFTQAWTLYEDRRGNAKNALTDEASSSKDNAIPMIKGEVDADKEGDNDKNNAKSNEGTDDSGKHDRKAKRSKNGKAGENTDPNNEEPKTTKPPPDKKAKTALAAAKASASNYSTVTTMAETTLKTIKDQDSWSWARTDELIDPLVNGLKVLREKVQPGSLMQSFLMSGASGGGDQAAQEPVRGERVRGGDREDPGHR